MRDSPPIFLHNSLTGKKEEFIPQDEKNVRMYVCGPTVYAPPHIGNMRPVVVFDVLYRLLRWKYGAENVTYVRNITDVDDKIIEAAREQGVEIGELTKKVEKEFNEECEKLGALPPDETPHATEFIPQMQELVKKLLARGVAYEAGGEVLFDVSKYANYGELSGRTLEEQEGGARVAVASHKRNPGDFVLWKPAPDDEPGWDSPWGRGRPGWHLECSAMSYSHFGESFDIHGGGQDLLFPHHENERAQTCSAFGSNKEMATFWLHNGYVLSDGKKMAKSEGNVRLAKDFPFFVEGMPSEAPGAIMRWALLSGHYKKPINIDNHFLHIKTDEGLDVYDAIGIAFANSSLEEANIFWNKAKDAPPDAQVLSALCDDLNTHLALTRVRFLAKEIYKSCEQKTLSQDSLRNFVSSIYLLQPFPILGGVEFIWKQYRRVNLARESRHHNKMMLRSSARANQDWALADKIRDELAEEGLQIKDNKDGTTTVSYNKRAMFRKLDAFVELEELERESNQETESPPDQDSKK